VSCWVLLNGLFAKPSQAAWLQNTSQCLKFCSPALLSFHEVDVSCGWKYAVFRVGFKVKPQIIQVTLSPKHSVCREIETFLFILKVKPQILLTRQICQTHGLRPFIILCWYHDIDRPYSQKYQFSVFYVKLNMNWLSSIILQQVLVIYLRNCVLIFI